MKLKRFNPKTKSKLPLSTLVRLWFLDILRGPVEQDPMVQLAKIIATEAHRGIYRNDEKTPYIKHPEAVVKILLKVMPKHWRYERKRDILAAAWLHDVLEDTALTPEYLRRRGISKEVMRIVKHVTRNNGESYQAFIQRSMKSSSSAILKWADIQHNINDGPSTLAIQRYKEALPLLENKINQ